MHKLPAFLLAASLSAIARGQAAPPDPRDVVVLGSALQPSPGALAYSTTVIDRARLTNDASGRIEDVLLDVAGFQQFRRSDSRSANPSAQGVTLRALGGNASSRALVLLDGVPQADPFFGYIPFNAVDPSTLGRVRVTRGGGAGAFGAGAVAGTIELESADRAALPELTASASYGSRNSQDYAAAFSPNVGSGYVSLAGRFERGDGYYTSPASARGPADARARYGDGSATLRIVTPIDDRTEIEARGVFYRDHRTLRFVGQDSSSSGEDASVRLVRHGDWAIDALAYLQARDFTNRVISSTNFRLSLDQRATPSTGTGGKIELRPPIGDHHVLRIGVDARRADGTLFEDAYSTTTGLVTARRTAGGNTTTIGGFVEDDWTIGRLVLTGGGRVDRWAIDDGFFREANAAGTITTRNTYPDRDGVAGTGRVGARFDATDAIALRTAAYTGFRLPTLNELYRPFTVFPIVTMANANLGLERLRGIEAGVDLRPAPGVTLSATAFSNRLGDAIANVTIGTNLRQRRNVDAIVANGIELGMQAATGAVTFNASYAYTRAHVSASGTSAALDGLQPAQTPRHAASGTLSWAPAHRPSLSATIRYVGPQYEDDLQTNLLPGAVTVDSAASLPIGSRFAFVGRVENLFDATVVTRNSGGSIDLGTPRTLWIGLRLR